MAHRVLHDPEADGWERSDFPIVCETCLGPNPYVRMQRIEYGAECHISKRPYTKFRWRPGSDARYKATIICQEVAKAKNVCQVCLLDLSHNLPVQVRDQLTNAVVEDIPESQVGIEYQLALKQSRGELGKEFDGDEDEGNDQLNRLSRTTPYYKRNRAKVCTYYIRGKCNRGAECPFRHEMPEGGELAHQNIRDRYYGNNDPVARKMLRRLGERPRLDPPEDTAITTLYVGNVERNWTEDDLRSVFSKHGELTRIKLVPNKSCAFVTYAQRDDAEKAADKLHDALIINGVRCKLLWGKPQAQTGPQQHMQPYPTAGGPAGVPGGPGGEAPFGQPLYGPDGTPLAPPRLFGAQPISYPSMDPSLMGAVPRGPALGAAQPAAVPDGAAAAPMHMHPPPHMPGIPPPGAFPPGMPPPGNLGPPMGGGGPPMGAMRPPGMPPRPRLHAPPAGMGIPPPGSIMPPGAMPPVHPGAQSGFGMVARPRMGAGAAAAAGAMAAAGGAASAAGGSGNGAGPSGAAAALAKDAPPGPEAQGAAA